MISFIQRLAITLLIFSSLSNIASAQMTDKAEVESTPTESQTGNRTVNKPPAKPKPKPKQSIGKCISNCSLPNATSYIRNNFDGRERTVRITVTYNKKGKVTDVQINPSTGNSEYDRVIREDAFKLRFSKGKAGTLTYRFRIVEQPSDNSGKCISNCSLPKARSYIQRNYDGKERSVITTVTYNENGRVTDVQINPSTGNSKYDSVIREDAFKLRFSPGKAGIVTFVFNIVKQRSGILSNAISYINRNFDGKERTVRITVTYNKNGKVTDVQINPSTGNSSYDRVIRRDARRLRFSPGKAGTVTFNFNIGKPGSQKAREAERRRQENQRRRREAEERRRRQEEAKKQREKENQPQPQPTRKPITPKPVTPPKPPQNL